MPVRVFWLRLSLDIVFWLCWITTLFRFVGLQTSEWCLDWPAVGLDSIVEGQESVDDLGFQPGQSLNRVRILCKLSCVHSGFSVPLWAQGLRCVLIVIMRSLFTSVMGECGHRSDLARLLKWSCSYKDWVPWLSRDVFYLPYLNGSPIWIRLIGFESRACPWLVQIGWPLVYPTVSLGLLKVHSSRCVVQFCFMWTTCGVCVLNFRRVIVSGRRIICPLQWGFVIEVEANLISTPVLIDAITV
jgi:hypothetical protein